MMKSKYFTKEKDMDDKDIQKGGILASLNLKEGKMIKRPKEKPQNLNLLAKNLMEKRRERLQRFEEPDLTAIQLEEKKRLFEKAKVPFIKQQEMEKEKEKEVALKAKRDVEENKKRQALEDIKILLADLKSEAKKSRKQVRQMQEEEAGPAEEEAGPAEEEEEVQEQALPKGITLDQRNILNEIITDMVGNEEKFRTENAVKKAIEDRYKTATGSVRMPTGISKLYPVLFKQVENDYAARGDDRLVGLDMGKRSGKVVGKGLIIKKRRAGRPRKEKSEADVKVEKRPVGRPRKTPYVMPELTEPRKVGKPRLKKIMM